ncbi:hypothetical protein F4778DRAFT_773521 [Xylariomycetidae sp. FL2044]|nr:hypothetical protein F4778DRAFT_773521 [Xylariomycetidae sp. FL2044]
MATQPSDPPVKELHRDLGRRYRAHGARIETIWRSWGQEQRTKIMKAGVKDGAVLKHSLDPSLGYIYSIMPEWNLRDIAAPGSELFLDILKHRATETLAQQYMTGPNGRPGDYELIIKMMQTRNLRHRKSFKDCYTYFAEEEYYGQTRRIVKDKEAFFAAMAPAIDTYRLIPQATGQLILTRQCHLMQFLLGTMENILFVASTTSTSLPKKSTSEPASTALSKLSIQPTMPKIDFADLHNSALDQKSYLEDSLSLVCKEPVVLAHVVDDWYFSRPELIADEEGRSYAAYTDRVVSVAVLDSVDSAIKSAAVWDYMCQLLSLFRDSSEKSHRVVLLQEISNLCHLEYNRVQALLKRHVSTGIGTKWFKRISDVQDNGNPRINMKGKPDILTGEDPQLYYLLRLCQTGTNASKAIVWIKKLDELHRSQPEEREKLADREVDTLSDLAVIVGFIHSLSPVISMPSLNRKKGQFFISRLKQLEGELNRVKPELDVIDFAVPIYNLVEPGMAEGALKALDQFIIEKTGTKLGFLYQDLVKECMAQLKTQLEQKPAEAEFIPLPAGVPEPPEVIVQQRRQKEKTRPAGSSTYEILPSAHITASEDPITETPPPFKVKMSTYETFSTLFSKSKARGSVSWTGFESAMGELGFSVLPKFGSVYTFYPPESLGIQRPITLHRPHKSQIEGYVLLTFARRLHRIYGWGERSFQAV